MSNEYMTASSDLLLEGAEMGAVSAAVEVAARRLLRKIGADENSVAALHAAKVGIVLAARHLGMAMVPEDKQEFVSDRLDIALTGVAATASYQASQELMSFMTPLLETLMVDTGDLMKLLTKTEVMEEPVREAKKQRAER